MLTEMSFHLFGGFPLFLEEIFGNKMYQTSSKQLEMKV